MASLLFSEGSERPTALQGNKQLIPNVIDGMAKTRPWALYAETPVSPTTYDSGYREITYGALASAINGVAWMLDKQLGHGKNFETLAYIGPNDLGYVAMLLGAVKAGYKLLLISPRNTIHDHISLFNATECKVLLTPPAPHSPAVTGILKMRPMKVFDSPSLNELLDITYPHYPFPKTFAEARSEPLVVLHTSGTTATPKPIIYTHDFAASCNQWNQLKAPAGFESQVSLIQSNRLFITMPFFHSGNIFVSVFDAIANQTTIITPLAGAVPSANLVIEGLKRTKADSVILAPPFFEEVAKIPTMSEFITTNVKTIAYGGGDVSEQSGNALSSRCKVFNFNGSTETGSYPMLRPSEKYPFDDWKYIYPHPASGIEFRPSVQGLFEAVLVRHPVVEEEQPVFKLFPHLKTFGTKDLFSPHPSKPGLWTYRGRVDDTIVFKPGYMCTPIAMEQHVSHHPEVRGALMTGTGRYQPALILETTLDDVSHSTTDAKKQELIQRIWPTVEEANQMYKTGSRVSKTHILITTPQQPMQRAGKGTVQRARTLETYKDALDALYIREGDAVPGNELVLPVFDRDAHKGE